MREMEGGEGRNNINNIIPPHSHTQVGLDELQQSQEQQQQQYQESSNDDFLNQMLSNISNCSWPPTPHDIPSPSSNPNNNNNNNNNGSNNNNNPSSTPTPNNIAGLQQMNEVTAKTLLLQHQQQFLMSRRPPGDAPPELLPSLFKSPGAGEASVQALYNGFAGSLQQPNQQHFHPPPPPPPQGGNLGGGPNFGGQGGAAINQAPPASAASTGGSSGGAAPQRQRVRARRGQATDPHSIAERLRRERIAERMKGLQELVPNANKTDKASMLDEIIDYVKFLQLQVKVLSMSRLGGAAAVAPRVADLSSEEGGGGVGRSSNGNQATPQNDSMTVTEHQVAKLMEEDMGSAMQYLQGKGLCLMPISLATAISTATSITRTPLPPPRPHINNNGAHHDITNNHHPLLPCIPPSNDEGDNNANAMSITKSNPNSDPSLKDP